MCRLYFIMLIFLVGTLQGMDDGCELDSFTHDAQAKKTLSEKEIAVKVCGSLDQEILSQLHEITEVIIPGHDKYNEIHAKIYHKKNNLSWLRAITGFGMGVGLVVSVLFFKFWNKDSSNDCYAAKDSCWSSECQEVLANISALLQELFAVEDLRKANPLLCAEFLCNGTFNYKCKSYL